MDGTHLELIPGDPPHLRLTLSEGTVSLSKDFPLEEADEFGRDIIAMAGRRRPKDFRKGD